MRAWQGLAVLGALLLCVGCVTLPISHGALAPCPEPSAGRITAGSAILMGDDSAMMLPVAALSLWSSERVGFVLSGDGLGLRARSRLVPVESLPALAVIPGISGSLQGGMLISGATFPQPVTEASEASIFYENLGLASGGVSLGFQIGLPAAPQRLERPRLYVTMEHSFERWVRFGSAANEIWDSRHATTVGVVWLGAIGPVALAPELVIGHWIQPRQTSSTAGFYFAFTIGVSAQFGRSS